MRRTTILALSLLAATAGPACELFTAIGGGETLPCVGDQACPPALTCLALGRCGLCAESADCQPAQECREQRCVERAVRPDAGHADTSGPDRARSDSAYGDAPSDLARSDHGRQPDTAVNNDHVVAQDGPATDRRMADTRLPDSAMSDAAVPDAAVPDTAVPDTAVADAGPACGSHCVVQIVAGGYHTCVLLQNGALKCWGRNNDGQLGLGDSTSRGGTGWEMGNALPYVDVGGFVVELAAGSFHNCARLSGGQVKCWGYNNLGQLGLGDIGNRGNAGTEMGSALPGVNLVDADYAAIGLTAGNDHSCAMFDSGNQRLLKCWGGNDFGQLGLGDVSNRGNSAGEMGAALPSIDPGSGMVRGIFAGPLSSHGCGLIEPAGLSPVLKCWGNNADGQLGLGDLIDRGDQPGQMGSWLPPVAAGPGASVQRVTAGSNHTCALFGNGQVKCWGVNNYGQLGQGDTVARGGAPDSAPTMLPAVDLGASISPIDVVAGGDFTCVLFGGGSVKCWGRNSNGQLGLGDNASRGDDVGEMGAALPAIDLGWDRHAQAIALGQQHACALLDDNMVKCWGDGYYQQLGIGDTADRGNTAGEMGDTLPVVNLGW